MILLGFFVNDVRAQNTIEWAAGYPKTGTVAQTITIKGTITPDKGWKNKDQAAFVRVWPVGGGAVREHPFGLLKGNDILENGIATLPSLVSGVEYWVTLHITFTDGTKDSLRKSTDPMKVKAK